MPRKDGSKLEAREAGWREASAWVWGDFKEKCVGFFLGFIFTQPLSKKGVSGALNKGHTQKKVRRWKKRSRSRDSSISSSWSPSPWERTTLPPTHLPLPRARLGRSCLARYDNPQEGTRQSIRLRRNAIPKAKLLDVSPDPSSPEFYELW